jgi:2-oxoglutarate ferredoxin oxidoreductase subunit alpha
MDAFKQLCAKYRRDPETGKNRYCIVQAEDELAAIGVVIGASWNGARSFTSTAGPGVSLMGELIGLAYYAEIPVVLVDVQRTGPSTGMPTRTQQGDILACAYASHGDTKHILLFPSNPAECFYFAVKSFDLAERFQTPVFMLTDLDIGMNDWVVPRLEWDDAYQPDRGQVLTFADLEKMEKFFRYSMTSWAGTPRSPTSTKRSWTASRASTRRRPRQCRPPSSAINRARRSASSRWAAATARSARPSMC